MRGYHSNERERGEREEGERAPLDAWENKQVAIFDGLYHPANQLLCLELFFSIKNMYMQQKK